MSHCGKTKCLETRWLKKCQCMCPTCTGAPEVERTTLDTQLDKVKADAAASVLNVGEKSAPVEVIGEIKPGELVTLKVNDPEIIASLKAGAEPVSVGYSVTRSDEQMWAPPPDSITLRNGVSNCARCKGDHKWPIVARRLTHPFAPEDATTAEGGQMVWTHWFPCPTNFEPVLVMVEAS